MTDPFIEFGAIILVVVGISIIMRILKQPLIIGYIFSGILVGPLYLNLTHNSNTIVTFSQMGISLLLFLIGLQLSPYVLKQVGKISLINGFGQIAFTVSIGFLISLALGFPVVTAIYIALAITFSSTIIVMKLLTDKDHLDKLYGKVSMGIALVQNLVAIIILIIISSISTSGGFGVELLFILLRGTLLILFLIFLSYKILPLCSHFITKSTEFLFLFAIAWGFTLSIAFLYIGFSIEVGALVAGILLSLAPYSSEISSKLKPLRDFFILFFFITLGSQMIFTDIQQLIFPAIIISLFILIGNPLIIMILMGITGYTKKTGFLAGLTVAQISEFSLILIAILVNSGQLPLEILSFMTIVAIITMGGSTYLILYSDQIYDSLKHALHIFERKNIIEKEIVSKQYKYILLGYNRIGFSITNTFKKMRKNFLIVDYNPNVVRELQEDGINVIFGDVDNSDFLEEIGIHKASIVVSTIPDKKTNALILDILKKNKASTITLLTGRQIEEAFDLYEKGANYVILPHFLGGEYTAKLIESSKTNLKAYQKEKNKELKVLHERIEKGHEHPIIEKNRDLA